MKANNLTICLPVSICTRNCPYCISKMTPSTPNAFKEVFSYERRIQKAISYAKTAGANSLLITARGEPLCDMEATKLVASMANDYLMPCELQTNGDRLSIPAVEELIKAGIDVFAVSIDSFGQIKRQEKAMVNVVDSRKVLRWTILLHDEAMKYGPGVWLDIAKSMGVHQLSFRKLSAPSNPMKTEPIEWIRKNTTKERDWLRELENYVKEFPVLRKLSFGPTILDAKGISLTYFPYCIEEGSEDEDLRSLILREDGHLYTTWSSLASILF